MKLKLVRILILLVSVLLIPQVTNAQTPTPVPTCLYTVTLVLRDIWSGLPVTGGPYNTWIEPSNYNSVTFTNPPGTSQKINGLIPVADLPASGWVNISGTQHGFSFGSSYCGNLNYGYVTIYI